jgi:hypothetical protein
VRTKRKSTISGLRLSEEELKAIVQAKSNPPGSEKRIHRRIHVPDSFPLLMQSDAGGGSDIVCTLVAKDLSAQGVGFFHAAYIYPGSRVKFTMKNREGEPVALEATVKRCRHIAGRVHEAGAIFEQPIDVELFVEIPPEAPAGGLDAGDLAIIQARVAALTLELKSLTDRHAEMDKLIGKVAELSAALLPAQIAAASLAAPAAPPAAAEPAPAGAPAPSGH